MGEIIIKANHTHSLKKRDAFIDLDTHDDNSITSCKGIIVF